MWCVKQVVIMVLIAEIVSTASAASIVVAPIDASEKQKARADYVCDGKDDQVELLASIQAAKKYPVLVDRSPVKQLEFNCYGRHSVEWLPGVYHLSQTLDIPNTADVTIHAESAYLQYHETTGDAIVVRGMNRCRFYFGTIESKSDGAALRIKPLDMPSLMSIVSFTGMIGPGMWQEEKQKHKGTGLYIDSSVENVCTNRFEGTDIAHFDTGIFVGAASKRIKDAGHGKTDTNWFWCSYIRMTNVCIQEQNYGVDDNIYFVNLDATEPDSIAARIGGNYGRWCIILGTASYHLFNDDTKSVIIDPGATHNLIEVRPPIDIFAPWIDNSGNDTNIMITTDKPPLRITDPKTR